MPSEDEDELENYEFVHLISSGDEDDEGEDYLLIEMVEGKKPQQDDQFIAHDTGRVVVLLIFTLPNLTPVKNQTFLLPVALDSFDIPTPLNFPISIIGSMRQAVKGTFK